MACTFSCTELLSRSYFLNTALKSGIAVFAIRYRQKPSTGIMPAKMKASCLPTRMDMMLAKISIIGARTAIRVSIINACWTFATSVVRRVTREDVENRSMFENEKSCTL